MSVAGTIVTRRNWGAEMTNTLPMLLKKRQHVPISYLRLFYG
jgi:hypothetical protein